MANKKYLNLPKKIGFEGNKLIEKNAEKIKANIVILKIVPVTSERFKDKTEILNFSPPTKLGNQPNKAIIIEFVDHDQKLSM